MNEPNPKPDVRRRFFSDVEKEALGWFWHTYMKSKTPWLFFVFVLVAIQGAVYAQFLKLTEDGLRVVFEKGSLSDLVLVCVTVFGVFIVRAATSYIAPRISQWIASNAVESMRNDMVARYMSLDLAYFERTTPGSVILRLVQQAQGLSGFIGQQTVNAVRDILTVIILSIYLIYKEPLLFTATAIVIPVIILVIRHVSAKIKGIQQTAENAMGGFMDGVEEMVSGMRTVKISGQEPVEEARLKEFTHNIRNLMIRLQAAQALMSPFVDVAAGIAYVVVIGGGGYMVLSPNYDIDGAGIITFLLGLVLVFDPGRRFSTYLVSVQASLVLLCSVRDIFHEVPSIVEKPGALDHFDPLGDIVLSDLTFRYSEDQPLFEGLNLTLKGGKVNAIVGPTGSGKTTILSLLGRLYDPVSGSISIGGTPISDIKIKTLRHSFSVVAQDIVVFNKSIFDNIHYVRPEVSEEEVWAAAEAAEIKDLMIARGGADVGPKGSQLSGGQKQRIAIARAFLRDAPIILLDEATSALDHRTEQKVTTALARLCKGKTTVTVAHRLSSVVSADQIFVLESGGVIETGDHANLMAADGLYSKLFKSQKQSFGD